MALWAEDRSRLGGVLDRPDTVALVRRGLAVVGLLAVGALLLIHAGRTATPGWLVPAAVAAPLALAVWFRPVPLPEGRGGADPAARPRQACPSPRPDPQWARDRRARR